MYPKTTIIIGANSKIAQGLAETIISQGASQLIVISRNTQYYQCSLFEEAILIQVDNYDEASIQKIIADIARMDMHLIDRVFICHGLLHSENIKPEKNLASFSDTKFLQVLPVNTIIPMIWVKYLVPLIAKKEPCKIVVFSARVGSIGDNNTGGWYSYRTSKAALNMLLKCAAVELSRTGKNIKLISFHPGTTDTPLSKPYQRNVPDNKLFTHEFVANKLLNIVADTDTDGELSFLDWRGEDVTW